MHALRSHCFPVLPRSLTGLRVFAVSKKAVTVASHPLDPLSASEIADVADACRSYAQEHGHAPIRFNTIGLKVNYHIDKNSFRVGKPRLKHRAIALAKSTYTVALEYLRQSCYAMRPQPPASIFHM